MRFWILALVGSWILDLLAVVRLSDHEKDLEILILRHQIGVLGRNEKRPRVSRLEKLTLALLANRLKSRANLSWRQLRQSVLIFTPETVLGWHRTLVRRKWTQKQYRRRGRPRKDAEAEAVVVRLAQENPTWGYRKIEGELLKLGIKIGKTTVGEILRRNGIPPAPQRDRSTRRAFLNHYKDQVLACDFFTVETVMLRTIYLLFFIELGTRRVHFMGCTQNPDSAWVTQQARNLIWTLQDQEASIRYLIHDRDAKFSNSFDSVFTAEGCDIILTPYRAPDANSIAERWVQSARTECIDKILIFNEQHLRSVLHEYSTYYDKCRPHQGLGQRIPVMPASEPRKRGPVRCRNVLGGIIHDYYRPAA